MSASARRYAAVISVPNQHSATRAGASTARTSRTAIATAAASE